MKPEKIITAWRHAARYVTDKDEEALKHLGKRLSEAKLRWHFRDYYLWRIEHGDAIDEFYRKRQAQKEAAR